MKNKMVNYLLIIFLFFGLSSYLFFFKKETYNEFLITNDGNFLFYNTPVAVSYKEGFFVAYLTREGKVKLDYWKKEIKISSILIHDYSDNINDNIGFADDHAAPAIIYDPSNDRLLLATAYHGSPMHIFEYDPRSGEANLLQKWYGKYTYPRFINYKDGVILTARNQAREKEGDFIYRYSLDNFKNEYVIMSSGPGHVIYSGSPAIKNNNLYFSYSIHSYAEKRLLGLNFASFDLVDNRINLMCDLSGFIDSDYFSNRPTGLNFNKEVVMLGSAYFKKPTTYKSAEKNNFSGENVVKILKGNVNECESFRELYVNKSVAMPYYDVDIAINSNGKFLFFNNNEVITNGYFKGCFNNKKMLYPNFIEGFGVLYASMNDSYSIREFDNSIYGCFKQ